MIEHAVEIGAEVVAALAAGRGVVALESTIISHGLPRPANLNTAREIEQTVRAGGAVPATIGMVGGRIIVGLDDSQLQTLAEADGVAKLSVRDLAPAAVAGVNGATTVAATAVIAARAGISVFATGGLGGVHRPDPGAALTYDESADLAALAGARIAVVCSGVKSILDVGATLERLESLGVAVIGYRSRRFPGFYLTDGGFDLDWSFDEPAQLAEVQRRAAAAVVVTNPLPVDEQLDPELHDRVLAEGLTDLAKAGVTGKAVTPYLLAHFHEATGGKSLDVNIRIILRNAALAAQIATAR